MPLLIRLLGRRRRIGCHVRKRVTAESALQFLINSLHSLSCLLSLGTLRSYPSSSFRSSPVPSLRPPAGLPCRRTPPREPSPLHHASAAMLHESDCLSDSWIARPGPPPRKEGMVLC